MENSTIIVPAETAKSRLKLFVILNFSAQVVCSIVERLHGDLPEFLIRSYLISTHFKIHQDLSLNIKIRDHRENSIIHPVIDVSTKISRLTQMKQLITEIVLSPEEVTEKTRKIYSKLIDNSDDIKEGNFARLSVKDLEFLFDQYDREFFTGQLRKVLESEKHTELLFTLSKRMTNAGGKTKFFKKTIKMDQVTREEVIYEISIAISLLFQTFLDVKRTIIVNGIVCSDRLEALQRIFEHELIHLLEFLVWNKSSCYETNFKNLVKQIFAHTETTHQLITQPERALKKYGIKIGDKVEFVFKNTLYIGIVNRITKRATILVENSNGRLYSDKKRYLKFYIPLSKLKKVVEPVNG